MLMEDRYRHNHNGNINQRMEVRLWKANKTIGVFFSCLSAVFIIGFMIFFFCEARVKIVIKIL